MFQSQLLWSNNEADDWDLDTVKTRLHTYEVSLWAAGFEEIPWGMVFLPNQEMLVTDISGILYKVSSNGKQKIVIKGLPKIFRKGQGGLLDVEIHPNFSKNLWIYLAYSDPFLGRKGFTSVARAKLIKNKLVDFEVIYRVDKIHATGKPYHFGSRLVFDQNNDLYFSIGDRGERDEAQLLTTPNGKIHRIHDNGEIPRDNPFYKKTGHIQSIWSYGNRNAQGLTIHPETGELWSTEHGPRGGDELNRIQKGLNYGWPVITYGINYIGTKITDLTEKEGMEQPVFQWTPSIALCGIKFYSGSLFKKWNNHLLITSLKFERLHRVVLEGNKMVDEEIIFEPGSRVRDVEVGPNECIYVALENPGRIVILKPI
ncbi:MAG: PQQ-dependent sugar dehydrogenase [Candidatus Neomarinimicrobiota bacterium]